MRLVRPFVQLLRTYESIPAGLLDPLDAFDADERIPIETLHELLRGAVLITGDEDIGLKAAREIEQGSLGALEYAAGSACTARDALGVIGRYMHLVNDALTFSVEAVGDTHTLIRLQSSVALPRAAEDFEVAAFHMASRYRFGDALPPFEVFFKHPGSDSSEYKATFQHGVVHFGSDFTGFRFGREALDTELSSRDPFLHSIISRHADQMLADLPKVETFSERVRAQLLEEVRSGDATAPRVARKLGVSVRTLTRKLEGEGHRFKDLLDELRHGLALRYTTSSDLLLADVALLLGFSSAAAFNRAFKRWTGVSPIEYRRGRRK